MYTTELQPDVEEAVEEDFRLHCRVADTAEFLKRLLPVEPAIVQEIFQKMKDDKKYDTQSQRWAGFPDPNSEFKENCLYGPFNAIAEAIRQAAEKRRTGTGTEAGPTMWADYHSRSPSTQDRRAAQLRPDILFALRFLAENSSKNDTVQVIWWLQIIAAAEAKRKEDDKWDDLIKQLMGYLRRILREQLDRRFVFGLTLGPTSMTVWMHDRSGVIGTKTAIDIHNEPIRFVQIIAAFTLLPPERLGFDPTTKLLVASNRAVPSYRPTVEFIEAYKAAPYNRRWVIKMNSGKEYVTVRTVSYVQAGFMRGRGPIVWIVVPYGEGEHESESKILVLKQSWRPRDVESEGNLYTAAHGSQCDNVGKIELCEDVLVSGVPDTTDSLIRRGLDDSTGTGKRPRNQRPESSDPYLHAVCTGPDDIKEVEARDRGSPVSRVRTRVVLSTYGWLIKYFSTLPELVRVLRDAIKGHKHLYFNGVLHRDVSPGNILIEWLSGSDVDDPSTSGRLIDLDRGKRGKSNVGKLNSPVDDVMNPIVDHWCSWKNVGTDVARQALEFIPLVYGDPSPAFMYISNVVQHALQFRGLTQETTCTPHDLRWNQVEKLYDFDFDASERQKGSRTGTPPYTSGEILESQRYFHDRGHVFHDAVHDLESFFWVLVHICLTRRGPGGVRREELEEENENEEFTPFRRVIFCLFDSSDDTMRANKRHLFSNPHHLEQFVLANFHDYFHTLKGIVKEWFHVLRLAHQFHAFEYHNIHDMVVEILDKALGCMPAESIDEAGQAVLDKRKADIEELHGNPFGKLQLSPHPHASPSNQRQMSAVPSSPPSSPTPVPKRRKVKTLQERKDVVKDNVEDVVSDLLS